MTMTMQPPVDRGKLPLRVPPPARITGLRRNPANPKPAGKYRFLDIFAGIGGFRFGLEPAGGACVWSCEINRYARRTYSVNHAVAEEDIFVDVREADAGDVPDHEMLIAGFPCQPFSRAGVSRNRSLNRPHGFMDLTRGTLFFEIARVLDSHRPEAFLLENVPGLLTHDQGHSFEVILKVLAKELGYHVSHRVIDALHYVPQRRRRLFIAGQLRRDCPDLNRLDLPPAESTLAEILHPQDGTEQAEPPYTSGPAAQVSAKYTLGDGTWNALLRHREKHANRGNGFGFTIADPGQPSRTLTARYGKDGQEVLIATPDYEKPRRLTPRECSRLMGMPRLQIPVSDRQAYHQLGNSVVPALVEDLADYLMGQRHAL